MSGSGTHILIQIDSRANGSELTDRVAQIPGVTRVTRVAGPYDVVVEVGGSTDGVDPRGTAEAIRRLDGVLHAVPLTVAPSPAGVR